VFLTGGAVTPDAEAFLARPDVRALTKPVNLAELSGLLESVADGAATEGNAASPSPPGVV